MRRRGAARASGIARRARQGNVFADARPGDAYCAVFSPACLECHRRILLAGVNAEAVAKVDHGSVARRWVAVAAVVGARHMHAGLMQRAKRRAAGPLLPGPITPADAFADGTAGASEVETAAAVGHRKAEAAPLRVRRAHVRLSAVFVLDDEMMQHDAAADGFAVVLHASDRDFDVLAADADLQRRAHEVGASQDRRRPWSARLPCPRPSATPAPKPWPAR